VVIPRKWDRLGYRGSRVDLGIRVFWWPCGAHVSKANAVATLRVFTQRRDRAHLAVAMLSTAVGDRAEVDPALRGGVVLASDDPVGLALLRDSLDGPPHQRLNR